MGMGKRAGEGGGWDGPGYITGGRRQSVGADAGVNYICNKTCNVFIGSTHLNTFGGSSATATSWVGVSSVPTGPSPVLNRRHYAKRSSPTSGHLDICTIFLLARLCTLQEVAGAYLMEEEITLLAQEEAARAAHIEARKERYLRASRINCIPKEKVVHWSEALDNKMEDTDQALAIPSPPHAPPDSKRGSEHQKETIQLSLRNRNRSWTWPRLWSPLSSKPRVGGASADGSYIFCHGAGKERCHHTLL
jgi:hypothetical protein